MKKSKNIIIYTALILVFLTTGIAYALFNSIVKEEISLSGGSISVLSDITCSSQEIFNKPGDKHNENITVTNNGNSPVAYSISLTLDIAGGLENAVLVYLDNTFMGVLGDLCSNGSYLILENNTLFINEIKSHIITLEFHLGASDYYLLKDMQLNIKSIARSMSNAEATVFVKNFYELQQIGYSTINADTYKNKTIKLTNDITFINNITFNKSLILDLNGKNLNFANFDLTYSGQGIFNIINNRNTGSVSGEGKIKINSANGMIIDHTGLSPSIFNLLLLTI